MKKEDEDTFFGRMNDLAGSDSICGPCGDELEFNLYIWASSLKT